VGKVGGSLTKWSTGRRKKERERETRRRRKKTNV